MSEAIQESQAALEGKDRPPEENEPIRSTSDLEQEKRTAQAFYAQGNVGSHQIFINNLVGALNMDSQRRPSSPVERQPDQTYRLHLQQDCAKFVERYKNSEYLAAAIALSTFEAVRLSDLPGLIQQLMTLLPSAGPEEDLPPRDPYISMDTILSAIGGEKFTIGAEPGYVGLRENACQALQSFWEQFPVLRDPICKWLIQVSRVYSFQTAFDARQMVGAFARVISLDFEDGRRRVLARMYSDQDSAGLLGNILCRLYENRALRPKLDELLLGWLHSEGSWLWRPACLACVFLWPELDHSRFTTPLRRTVSKRLLQLTRGDCAFLAVLLMQSEYFRTLLSDLLGQAVQKGTRRETRLALAQTYLYLLRSCYYIVDSCCPELPLAACDTREQQQNLTPILREAISTANLRRQLYVIMRAYLKELDHHPCSEQLFQRLCAYFYNMALAAPDYRRDILQFLADCEGGFARRIYERTVRLYQEEFHLFPTATSRSALKC